MRGSEFAELNAFATIAAHGSFARAAAHLRVSPSALSQTIRGLEERLGVRLLNRTTRSVAPSEAGTRLLARLTPVLQELEAAVGDVNVFRDRPAGVLRINSSRIAATHLLSPMLGPFYAAYPDVRVDVTVDDSLVDIVEARFDAGIRLGESLQKDMVAVKLGGALSTAVVASPTYLAEHGTPQTPQELRHHRCINMRLPTNGNVYRWEFERGDKSLDIAVDGPLVVNDWELVACASADGVGIGYLLDNQARPWLERGELVRILESWSPSFPGFYLYYPSRKHTPPALRAFVEFVRSPSA